MKELLEGFLSKLETDSRPKEGEYLGEDGLLYCGNCHTPVQCRKEFLGKMRTLPCTCKCRQEEMRRQKEEDEARERMNTIHRLKSTGIQERHLLDWRFDVAEETDTIRWAKNYVENWRKVRAENLGLLLWGDVGTGKSFAAACIANNRIDFYRLIADFWNLQFHNATNKLFICARKNKLNTRICLLNIHDKRFNAVIWLVCFAGALVFRQKHTLNFAVFAEVYINILLILSLHIANDDFSNIIFVQIIQTVAIAFA